MQNVLVLHSPDVREVLHALAEKRDSAPAFFLQTPIVVDCKNLGGDCAKLDFSGLNKGLRALSFVPVGLRHVTSDAIQSAIETGWAILRDSRSIQSDLASHAEQTDSDNARQQSVSDENIISPSLMVISKPVRSGQQVYSPDGDIVILSQTGAGSEVLAAGSVHVYGKIAGRVLAGVNGDRSARIFCQGLEAELIAIAGQYQLLDDVNTHLKGQPAMIYLVGDKLKIEPMV